jgi:hypothetical protein
VVSGSVGAVVTQKGPFGRIQRALGRLPPNSAPRLTTLSFAWIGCNSGPQLASAHVNLQLAQAEFHRAEELLKDKICSQRTWEQAKASRDALQGEVTELRKLVADGERCLTALQLPNAAGIVQVSDAPIHAAIAVQESKLHLMEAGLSPIILRAPIDGTSRALPASGRSRNRRSANRDDCVASAGPHCRLYAPPIPYEPSPTMQVQVSTPGWYRQTAEARLLEVGAQLESIPLPSWGRSGPVTLNSACP